MRLITKTLVLVILALTLAFPAGSAQAATKPTLLHVTVTQKHLKGQTWRATVTVKNVGSGKAVNPIQVKLWVAAAGDFTVRNIYIRNLPLRRGKTITSVFYFKARKRHNAYATAKAKNSARATSDHIAVPINPITWVVMALAMVVLARRRRKPAALMAGASA